MRFLFLAIFLSSCVWLSAQSEDVVYKSALIDAAYSDFKKGNFKLANKQFQNIVSKGQETNNINLLVNGFIGLSEVAFAFNDRAKAKQFVQKAKTLAEGYPIPTEIEDFSLIYQNLGFFYSFDQLDSSLYYYEKGYDFCKKNHGMVDMRTARAQYSLGGYYIKKGQAGYAISLVDEALQTCEQLGLVDLKAYCLHFFSYYYRLIGNFYDAENYQIAFLNTVQGASEKARAHASLSSIYYMLKDYDKAITQAEAGLAIDKRLHGDVHPSTRDSYITLHKSLIKAKRFKGLEKSILASLESCSKNPGTHCDSFNEMYARMFLAQNELVEAKSILRNSIDSPFIANSLGHINSQHLLAKELLREQELDKVEVILKKIISFYFFNTPEVDSLPSQEQIGSKHEGFNIISTYLDLNIARWEKDGEMKDLDNCLEIVYLLNDFINRTRVGINGRRIQEYLSSYYKPFYEKAIRVFYDKHIISPSDQTLMALHNLIEQSKNLSLFEHLVQNKLHKKYLPLHLYQQTKELKEELEQLNVEIDGYTQAPSSIIKKRQLLHQKSDSLEKVVKNFSSFFDFESLNRPISLHEIRQNIIKQDETYVSFVILDSYSLAVIIELDGARVEKIELTKDSLKSIVTQVQREIEQVSDKLIEPLNVLSKYFYQDLAFESKRLVISTDNPLNKIPFSMLFTVPFDKPDWKNAPFVLHTKSIRYAYSAIIDREFIPNEKNKERSVLALAPYYLGDKLRENNFVNLVHSKEELQRIEQMYPGKYLVGTQATKKSVLEEANNHNILHFATHTVYNPENSSLTYLLMQSDKDSVSDERKLYLHEIYNQNFTNDLVVLNTCNSGLGKPIPGEGMISIGRAFSFAGCKNIVVSLWSMSDEASAKVIEYFYQHYQNKTISYALQQAKIDYLANAPLYLSHPYYWAGTTYFGKPPPSKKQSYYYWFAALAILVFGTIWFGKPLVFKKR